MRTLCTGLLLLSLVLASRLFAQEPQGGPGPSAAQLYHTGMNFLTGTGVSRSDTQGEAALRRSATQGYAPAQVALGLLYESGQVVVQNPGEAASWYRKSADQGNKLAEWSLGRLYYSGSGVPRDLDQAARWLQKAADQGDPFGAYLLGRIKQERGDFPGAVPEYRRAARQGLPQAQQRFGELLMAGEGVPKDDFEAYVWLLVSFQNGNQAVATDLQQLEGSLGSAAVEQAKSKARDLFDSTARTVVAGGCTGWQGEFADVPAPPPLNLQNRCQ
ncbi:MAG TPA: tetratricopeptide repeat protein [Terriglobales bacterium]|jgi:TPR repeat protein|nr:tetratricopeptide repeat protein [Terriglobales bacterium]